MQSAVEVRKNLTDKNPEQITKVTITIPVGLLAQVDLCKADINRSRYIQRILERHVRLMMENSE